MASGLAAGQLDVYCPNCEYSTGLPVIRHCLDENERLLQRNIKGVPRTQASTKPESNVLFRKQNNLSTLYV